MIIDFHVHPFCKEATVLPDYNEALHRQFDSTRNEVEKQTIIEKLLSMHDHTAFSDFSNAWPYFSLSR